MRQFLVLFESEAACQQRLAGRFPDAATRREVASYLSQATDLPAHYEPIRSAFAAHGIELQFHELGELDAYLRFIRQAPEETMVWNLTDGFRYYRGSHVSSLARLLGARTFGSTPQAQLLCQDKFKVGVLAASLGILTPPTALWHDGVAHSPGFAAAQLFVKPNTLGAKLGIWPDSRCGDWNAAAALSRRIYQRYGDSAVVQAYIPGVDVRVSYLQVDNAPLAERLGVFRLSAPTSATGGDFMTMLDNATLSGTQDERSTRTRSGHQGAAAFTPQMEDLQHSLDPALRRALAPIRASVAKLAMVLGLRDYFSCDFRVTAQGQAYFLECEVCPAVTIYDFSAYLRAYYQLELAPALVQAVLNARGADDGF